MSERGLVPNTPAYLRARNNGFGQGRKPATKTQEITEAFEDAVLEQHDELIQLAISALKTGMQSGDPKLAVDAANKFLSKFHNPAKSVDLNVTDSGRVESDVLAAQEQMSEEELAYVSAFRDMVRQAAETEIIDAEIVSEEVDG